jgi:hypothetical protein
MEEIMRKLGLLSASAVMATLLCTGAQAMPVDALSQRSATPGLTRVWDNCGHGYHRNYWGRCVSNYGRTSGCPYGYHLGWNVHACVPN